MEAFGNQENSRFYTGDLLMKEGLITKPDIEKALLIQKNEKKGQDRTIGEILYDLNLVSSIELNRVLQKYNKQLKLGRMLLRQGILKEDQLNTALRDQQHSAEPLGSLLLKKNFISIEQLYTALSRQYNIPFKRYDNFVLSEKQKHILSSIVKRKYAEKNMALPLSFEEDKLTLGVSIPEKMKILQELSTVYSHMKLECVLITDDNFNTFFKSLYGKTREKEIVFSSAEIKRSDMDQLTVDLESVEDTVGKSGPYGILDMEAEEVVNFIIKYGIVNRASDIHIEQDKHSVKLRYRFDGMLHPLKLKWLDEKLQFMAPAIISRIKVMSNLDIAERRMPQDGVFRINYLDKQKDQKVDLDCRVATCPAIVGENLTIRVLDPRNANVDMNDLGHSTNVLNPLKQLLKSSSGMILVSGPTGSGKSTTLYSALQYIRHPGIKIITAEDPIEYSFPGIMQTQINPKIGLNFPRSLRSFLRLDPDVILVGEIRDEETARISFDAAQTGHLLLSTIHTNDSFSSISRLLDLNIEHNQIASSLMGILAQRLVRKICPLCRKPYAPTPEEWELVYPSYPDNINFQFGEGCDECHYTGYKGRTLISELLVMNREIISALNRGFGEDEIKRIALNSGTKSMVDDGLMKLDQTTLSEIVRVVPYEMLKEFRSRKKQYASGKKAFSSGTGYLEDRPRLLLRNPDSEQKLIDGFYNIYLKSKEEKGMSSRPGEKSYFKEFINDNYREVCNRFNCYSVLFYLDDHGDHIKIVAEPIR